MKLFLRACGWLGVCPLCNTQSEFLWDGAADAFYRSLWPEPINSTVKGQQLGNNDSILMMFVHVCVCVVWLGTYAVYQLTPGC